MRPRARVVLSSVAGFFLSIVLAGQSMAATWSEPIAVTTDDVWIFDACRPGEGDSALAAYSSFNYVAIKRSNNGGATWQREAKLAQGDVFDIAIACRGRKVDVVWQQSYRLQYALSGDGGRTFGSPRRLSPWKDDVVDADVARGPDGLVAVVWTDENSDTFPDVTNRVRVRISHDGGVTFSKPRTIAAGAGGSIAVGDGVIYVAYWPDDSRTLELRRSTDGGSTWSPPISITANLWDVPDVVARGSEAYVGYTQGDISGHWVAYRHTHDAGESWSMPVRLGSKRGHGSADVRLNLDGDLIQAAYMRCGDKHCNYYGKVMYRESVDGVSWAAPEFVVGGALFGRRSLGAVVSAGRPLVLYTASDYEGNTFGLSRFRTP